MTFVNMIKKIIKLLLPRTVKDYLKVFYYYHKLGLSWYFFRDKLGSLTGGSAAPSSKHYPSSQTKIKILYLYNIEGWAVQNVGRLWLDGLTDVDTTFLPLPTPIKDDKHQIVAGQIHKYDFVWFGYLEMYFEFCKKYAHAQDPDKVIVTIHDPMELFPICEDWRSRGMKQYARDNEQFLRELKHIVVIYKEFQSKLLEYNIKTDLIPTMSLIPPIEKVKIRTRKCDILSIAGEDRRKNFELLGAIKKYCKDKGVRVRFHEKIGTDLLPMDTYIRLIDNHEIYICTSFMEGGPLPAMDAMNRGLVVLTTPVGQIQEIIEDGKNGFICKTKEDFVKKIAFLSKNLDILQKMRISSRETICEKRNQKLIREKVSALFRAR